MRILLVFLEFLVLLPMSVGASFAKQELPADPGRPQGRSSSQQNIHQIQKQADAGDASAQNALGKAYQDGTGLPRDPVKAAVWYRKAAEQGNAEAATSLGLMYQLGSGVEKNPEEAVVWYRKGAKERNVVAMFNLAAAFFNGDGVLLDDIKAYAWFLLAQEAGSEAATDGVRRLTEDLRKDQKSDALQWIGEMYEKGEELPQSYGEAAKWYGKAADAGSLTSTMRLASYLLEAKFMPADYEKGRSLCERAADHEYAPGMFCLGSIYQKGQGVPPNPTEAVKWFTRAAERRYGEAAYILAGMYLKGEGVKQSKKTAYMYLFVMDDRTGEIAKIRARLEPELTPKEVEDAKKDAALWVKAHPFIGLRERT